MTDRFDEMAEGFYKNTPLFASNEATPQQQVLGVQVKVSKISDAGQLADLLRQIDKEATERAAQIAEGFQFVEYEGMPIENVDTNEHILLIAKAIREQS